MVKLPIQASRWATLGLKQNRYVKIQVLLSLGFLIVTFNHCKELAAKLREQKVEDLRSQVDSVAYNPEAKEQMLKVFGIKNK